MSSNLFQYSKTQPFKLSSGALTDFKIECDNLTDNDMEFFAAIISKNFRFRKVYSVPTSGDRLAAYLKKYEYASGYYKLTEIIVVDDVLTTGNSLKRRMDEVRRLYHPTACISGIALFDRGDFDEYHTWHPYDIHAVFTTRWIPKNA